MCKYSVIIPVYNAEKFLGDCIHSVLNQSAEATYEIILVDDGSTDGSAGLCDMYAEKYSCICTVHQSNQGVSAARNRGIQKAKGEYVLFLDCDDVWAENLLEAVDAVSSSSPELIHFGIQEFTENGLDRITLPYLLKDGETGAQYLHRLFGEGSIPVASSCSNAYRRAFLMENNLSFPTGIKYGEDLSFRMDCLQSAENIKEVPEPLYRYRIYKESSTHTLSVEKLHDLLSVCADIYRRFPYPVLAEYYCMNLLNLADLKKADVCILYPLLKRNREILFQVKSKKAQLVRLFFTILGWYQGAKLVQILVRLKNRENNV